MLLIWPVSSGKLIEQLRTRGRLNLLNGDYNSAADCYSAILQKLEGVAGDEAVELMRSCGLTLAECEIRLGNFLDAVARCTEVIDETPPIPDTSTDIEETLVTSVETLQLQQTLGRAFYRRAVAFHRLSLPQFAYLDLLRAEACLPFDTKTARMIDLLRERTPSAALIPSNSTDSELQDTLEEAATHFSRKMFTSNEIRELLHLGPPRRIRRDHPVTSNPFDEMRKLMGNGMAGNGLDEGGLGGLLGMVGAGAQSGGLQGLVASVLEPGNLKHYMEIFEACNGARKWVTGLWRRIRTHHQYILWALSIVWVLRLAGTFST
jgi:hypothetical protein